MEACRGDSSMSCRARPSCIRVAKMAPSGVGIPARARQQPFLLGVAVGQGVRRLANPAAKNAARHGWCARPASQRLGTPETGERESGCRDINASGNLCEWESTTTLPRRNQRVVDGSSVKVQSLRCRARHTSPTVYERAAQRRVRWSRRARGCGVWPSWGRTDGEEG